MKAKLWALFAALCIFNMAHAEPFEYEKRLTVGGDFWNKIHTKDYYKYESGMSSLGEIGILLDGLAGKNIFYSGSGAVMRQMEYAIYFTIGDSGDFFTMKNAPMCENGKVIIKPGLSEISYSDQNNMPYAKGGEVKKAVRIEELEVSVFFLNEYFGVRRDQLTDSGIHMKIEARNIYNNHNNPRSAGAVPDKDELGEWGKTWGRKYISDLRYVRRDEIGKRKDWLLIYHDVNENPYSKDNRDKYRKPFYEERVINMVAKEPLEPWYANLKKIEFDMSEAYKVYTKLVHEKCANPLL